MLRGTIAVVVGYVVMAITVFAIFSLMFGAIGQDRAFAPGSYTVTWFWLLPAFVVSAIAAIAGGYICARISPGRAPQVLAAIVLCLGILLALPVLNSAADLRPTVRRPGISNLEAMTNARQPVVVSLFNPVVGLVGVLIGARGARKTPRG